MSEQVDRARALYSRLAGSYDAETRFITGIRRLAIETLALKEGETVVDCACGTGWCLPELARRVGVHGRVLGFDASPDMLALARQRVEALALGNVALQQACGATAHFSRAPDALLFSYAHDVLQSRASLARLFAQARPGARLVAVGTQLFPPWFWPGNAYLRYTHRATITNFENFDRPWRLLPEFCERWSVRRCSPGSRYQFQGVLRFAAADRLVQRA
jgi:demethylmenaquinone methyltransferase/2-methoxy-6-polyprenyl-1,4-benzoquinol methylase